ncbi:MAG: hypothetical protein Q8P24_20210, partial [Desulfobacterales bacterium]|nr:hypothetical protein [Desulfobacterales bacterium]
MTESQSTTKDKIKNIGRIFEKGLQDEYLSRSIGKIIEHERDKTLREIEAFGRDLVRFEDTYHITSNEFFERFEKGELGDSEDYFEWSAIVQMHRRSTERLAMLEGEA